MFCLLGNLALSLTECCLKTLITLHIITGKATVYLKIDGVSLKRHSCTSHNVEATDKKNSLKIHECSHKVKPLWLHCGINRFAVD